MHAILFAAHPEETLGLRNSREFQTLVLAMDFILKKTSALTLQSQDFEVPLGTAE